MANFFQNNPAAQQGSPRYTLQMKYNSARSNLLLVILFTLINIVLLVTQSGRYFLFSAFIPYVVVDFGMILCGHYPMEFYEYYEMGTDFVDNSFMVVCCVVAAIILVAYLLSWILSKKPRVGWIVFALVLFALDTVVMLLMSEDLFADILDIVFHGWVIFSLVNGIISHKKLKDLPEEITEADAVSESAVEKQDILE